MSTNETSRTDEQPKPTARDRARGVAAYVASKPVHVVSHAATTVTLCVVIGGLAQRFGHMVGLEGKTGFIAGAGIAVLFDLLWLGFTQQADTALKARQYVRAGIAGALAAGATAASVVMLVKVGHLPALSYLPAVAFAVRAATVLMDAFYASRSTAVSIAQRFDTERDALAVHNADMSLTSAERDRRAEAELAAHADNERHQRALAALVVAERIKSDEQAAGLWGKVDQAQQTHGTHADQFRDWLAGDAVLPKLALPVLGPVSPVRPALPVGQDDTKAVAASGPKRLTATVRVDVDRPLDRPVAVGLSSGNALGQANAARAARTDGRIAAVRSEGLDVDAIVARWKVSAKTAKRYLNLAAEQGGQTAA
ncbi:hypothetical protein [Streptomyces sp. NBC_01314]|uniref:hypothetical protein n=1 Tax=Streptomyces sp. NBC_01314 TaxID=2903821 RepID=UPI00308A4F31|nr:hypothetical protein OG622_10850 [Streptomyces sp. NBC_01314]